MKVIAAMVFSVFALFAVASVTFAEDPMSKKEATPDLKERLTKDAVKGTLMKMDGEYYWIKDEDGKEVRVHVDTSTKMDKVVKGDRVKAYITDKGHVTTLQRLEK
ncbi:MAG TPA: hypothetical protein VHQ67_02865 [Nitrospiraceae bacterium]|nr:hypothetical protein [Nitrospiraceae bacterium]